MEKTARKKDSRGRPLGLSEKYYLRKKVSDAQGRYFFGGGSLHTPEMVFITEDAALVTGSQLENMAWDWTMDWEAVPFAIPEVVDLVGKWIEETKNPVNEGPREANATKKRVTANIRPEDLLIHQIEEYPSAEILEVIRHLGEESIAGFSPVQEDEIPEVLAICEQHELGEILQKLQRNPPPRAVNTYSDMFEQIAHPERFVKTFAKTAQVVNPLQGMTNTRARKFVNDLIHPFTEGFFKDDSWKPVHELFNALRQSGVNFETYLPSGRVSDYTQNENGVPISKEWWFTVKFINASNRETILYGHIQASFCGPVNDISSRYDLTAVCS